MREITKISIKAEKVSISYILQENQDKDTHEVNFYSYDIPEPDFVRTLQSLDADVISILELENEYKKNLKVVGVSIKNEEAGLGCCIQAIKILNFNDAPFCINTPYRPPKRSEHMNTDRCINIKLNTKLEKLQHLAGRYLNGEREQIELFKKEKNNEE